MGAPIEKDGAAGLVRLFDARDDAEVARLADTLSESIHVLDIDLARAACALPVLKASCPHAVKGKKRRGGSRKRPQP
jgi:hypothetical protein